MSNIIGEIERDWVRNGDKISLRYPLLVQKPIDKQPKKEVDINAIIAIVVEYLKSVESMDFQYTKREITDNVLIEAEGVYLSISKKLYDNIINTIESLK